MVHNQNRCFALPDILHFTGISGLEAHGVQSVKLIDGSLGICQANVSAQYQLDMLGRNTVLLTNVSGR